MSLNREGWVYVMIHPAFDAMGMVKVGMTGRDPVGRVREITSASGLIKPGKVFHCVHVPDRRSAERQIHGLLRDYRVRSRRELFRVTPEYATWALNQATSSMPVFLHSRQRPVVRVARQRRHRTVSSLLPFSQRVLGALVMVFALLVILTIV